MGLEEELRCWVQQAEEWMDRAEELLITAVVGVDRSVTNLRRRVTRGGIDINGSPYSLLLC